MPGTLPRKGARKWIRMHLHMSACQCVCVSAERTCLKGASAKTLDCECEWYTYPCAESTRSSWAHLTSRQVLVLPSPLLSIPFQGGVSYEYLVVSRCSKAQVLSELLYRPQLVLCQPAARIILTVNDIWSLTTIRSANEIVRLTHLQETEG